MFEIFIMVGMMMGFILSNLYLLQHWYREAWQGAGMLGWLRSNSIGQRSSPTISREELEKQYIKVMQNNVNIFENLDTVQSFEGGEGLRKGDLKVEVENKIQNLLEGGRSMADVKQQTGIELVKVPVVIGENTIQQMFVTDLALNFCAIRVRDVEATIQDITATVINDKVIIQGLVYKQIFFVDENNVVRYQTENIPFSFFIDIPGAEPGMDVKVHPIIEHIKTDLLDGGCVLHQKIVVEFFVIVTDMQQIFVEVGEGPLVKLEKVVGENSVQTLVPSELKLPVPATKIIEISAQVQDIICEVIEDKVIVQGIVHKQIFFIGEDNIERHIGEDVSFSTFVDVPGAEAGQNYQVEPTIEFIKRELSEDGIILVQEVVLDIFVRVTENVQLNLVTGEDILLKVPEVINENVRQILLENTVQLPVPAIEIKEINATVIDVQSTIINDKVIIHGVVHKQIFFIDEDNIERHLAVDIPFSTFVEVPGAKPGMKADISPVIEFIKPELVAPSDILNQRIVIEIFVRVTQSTQISIPEVVVGPYGPGA
ncbi:hypothetical protein BBF96_14670 [Anoxybacter fermentans]|uniref:SipL SPOCS domain-containing protein n=1 Tax=Anoxybacter fermentans TaxID=1323375 RepID=A0A3S9T1W9_9FIRM|nr:DUF3794 domain-containing protein [Anoxybacter fermentans]AZR74519.1 hypothetical protein BBF96_14670 [Anoxybacter fermentans]